MANINRAAIAEYIRPVRLTSAEAASIYDREPIDILFIDGSHDYADVKLDIDAWTRFLSTSSMVIFNDPYAPGVNRAMREYLQRTTFLKLTGKRDKFLPIKLGLYLFVERQTFKLLKLLMKSALENVGIIYRKTRLTE